MKFKNNPERIFQKTFGFAVFPSSTIEKYLINREGIILKIRIDECDKEIIESKLIEHYKPHYPISNTDYDFSIPHFENVCSWWDMNRDEIITSYTWEMEGKKVKTRTAYAFFIVTQQKEYYLYIDETFG